MPERSKTPRQIFSEALEKQTAAERMSYLEEICGNNADLRSRLESLLQAHEMADDFLEVPVSILYGHGSPDTSTVAEDSGTVIGRYKLLEKIGEGGMAVVYMAEQERPVRRKVALKIIKQGMDTQQVIARFEAERQALAMMDHPNIAKVLDGGATETGRPYFVMDLVRGVSITDSCDRNELSINDRLDLFVQVCRAVQHAHQKGIIHRDIKPTNVMVAQQNGTLVPKVIDFGVAKAINQRLTEKTLFTRYAHIIGTPAYMSPEQAELSNLDVDTRTDIYSLGILLYELLTGTPPFSEAQLCQAGYLEMQRVIREEEPTEPSTKLSMLGNQGDTLTDIARQRRSTPELLRKTVRGDLDWIVMKSLEKDRTRRYETASTLAQDVQHYLHHEPVQARSPGVVYRLQKCLRRHRNHALVGLVGLVLIVALIALLGLHYQNQGQLAQAESLRHADILSQARQAHAAGDLDAARKTIESILQSEHVGAEAQLLVAGIFVDEGRGDEALTKLEGLLEERPAIAGAAHTLLARLLWENPSTGPLDQEEIDKHRQQAAVLLPETAEAYYLRASIALTIKEKLALLDRALLLDNGHYASHRLRAYTNYASRKYKKMEPDVIAMTALHPDDPLGYSLWATALGKQNDDEGAVAKYDRALELTPPENPQQAVLCAQRCEVLLQMEDYHRVLADAQDCLRLFPEGIKFHFYRFCALTALGQYEEAIAHYEDQIADSNSETRQSFSNWSMKYVYDRKKAGQLWHPQNSQPLGYAYHDMLEAEEIFDRLAAKAKPLLPNGFTPDWSPDGTKVVFSLGIRGCSGIAVYDTESRETKLLIVPGKNPKWSPDGQTIAFVRDRRVLSLSDLTTPEREHQPDNRILKEIWSIGADGTGARRLTKGYQPSWSQDSKHVYFFSPRDQMLYSLSIEDREAQPEPVMETTQGIPVVSPDNRNVAILNNYSLQIVDLASRLVIHDWKSLPLVCAGNWAPANRQFCMGGNYFIHEHQAGLWIFDLDTKEAARILSGPVTYASWSPQGKALTFCLGLPFYEIWRADIDPNVSAIEALGPGQTLEEFNLELVDEYTRKIEADPEDAESYHRRAYHYHNLHDQEHALTDMNTYLSLAHGFDLTNAHERWFRDFLIDLWQSTPTNLGPTVNSSGHEGVCGFSANGLSLYLDSDRSGGHGSFDVWITTRPSASDPWIAPMNLGSPINTEYWDGLPSITSDGLTLFLSSNRPGGQGGQDIWVSKRTSTNDPWETPVNLGPTVNSADWEWSQCVSVDGTKLYFGSNRPGGEGAFDVWVTTRQTINDDWGIPVNLGPGVNSPAIDVIPSISPDSLTLFITSERTSSYGYRDIWVTTRSTTKELWSEPVNLGPPLNTSAWDQNATISADGSMLYFCSWRPDGFGRLDIWQVEMPAMPVD
ncbi:protein kinase [Planctomycetota bacterium]